ncbi:MAG TPA: ABC transporter permease subunit [Candidatus Gemmiger stercoripullorum]|nr:ABC transporter permease subunit [Candidatus Gemmiger stercoripullorum]
MAVQVKDAGSRQLEKKRFWKEVGRQKVLLIWAAVFVVYGFVFCYLPLAGWLMAFQNYKPKDGLFGSQFVGLAKFQQLFSDDTFLGVIRNTLAMGVLNLVTTFVMAILFAILLNEVRTVWWKKTIQTISYLPHFLSWIIVTGILHDALSSTGIVNELLVNLGIFETELNFFAYPKYFWGIVAFANVWKETGWNAIIYLAAITSIDPSLYEAASIDGAGRFAKIWNITLPGIRSTIMILLLMNVGNVLNAGFEVQYLLGNGLVQNVSQTIDIYVLKWGISQGDYAIGTAAGIFKSVVSIVLIVAANMFAKRTGDDSLF